MRKLKKEREKSEIKMKIRREKEGGLQLGDLDV